MHVYQKILKTKLIIMHGIPKNEMVWRKMQVKYAVFVAMLFVMGCAFASLPPQVNATGNVIVLSHYGYFEPILKIYWVLGEVKNVGDTPVTNVIVNITFYDATNAYINSTETFILWADPLNPPYSFVLLPGAKVPFFPVTFPQVSGSERVDHYSMTVSFDEYPAGKPVGLQISNIVCWIDDSDHVHVNGTITNTGTMVQTVTYAYATGYDLSGAPIGYSMWGEDNLGPGEAAPFDMEITVFVITIPQKTLATYSITAQSSQYAVPSEYNGIVPEFPSILATMLLMMVIAAVLVFCKKRQI